MSLGRLEGKMMRRGEVVEGLKRIRILLFSKHVRKVSLLKEGINFAQAISGGAGGGPSDFDPLDEVRCLYISELVSRAHAYEDFCTLQFKVVC